MGSKRTVGRGRTGTHRTSPSVSIELQSAAGAELVGAIVAVFAIQVAPASAVDDDAQNIIFTKRLHGAPNGIDFGDADPGYQNRTVTERGQQVGVGRGQQRGAVQDD